MHIVSLISTFCGVSIVLITVVALAAGIIGKILELHEQGELFKKLLGTILGTVAGVAFFLFEIWLDARFLPYYKPTALFEDLGYSVTVILIPVIVGFLVYFLVVWIVERIQEKRFQRKRKLGK